MLPWLLKLLHCFWNLCGFLFFFQPFIFSQTTLSIQSKSFLILANSDGCYIRAPNTSSSIFLIFPYCKKDGHLCLLLPKWAELLVSSRWWLVPLAPERETGIINLNLNFMGLGCGYGIKVWDCLNSQLTPTLKGNLFPGGSVCTSCMSMTPLGPC